MVWTDAIHAQEEAYRTRLSLSCTQMPDSKGILEARLLARIDRRYSPLQNETIKFVAVTEDGETELGTSLTNNRGIAMLAIDGIEERAMNEDSLITYAAYYDGSEAYRSNDDEIGVRRATITYEAYEEDSVRYVDVQAYTSDGPPVPLADYEIVVSVPRMFSDLNIGEDYTDEDGSASFEVPRGIPGDLEGNLDLKVRIIDADDYGNVQANFVKDWGVPRKEVAEAKRQLWSPDAPLWIVITFAVLMLAVWSHFGIIIYNLVKVKDLGKEATA